MTPRDGRVGPDEPVSTRRTLMTMTGSWSRWFAVGLVAYTIAVGAPPWVSAQQPEDKLEEKGRIRGASRSVLASIGPRRTTSGALPRNRVGRTSSRRCAVVQAHRKRRTAHRADRDARHLEQLARGRRHPVDPVDPKFWYEADLIFTWGPRCGRTSPSGSPTRRTPARTILSGPSRN